MQQKVALNRLRRHDYNGSCGGDFKVTSFQDVSMNLFSSIVRSVHKCTKYPRPSRRQSRPETVLSSERLEPRHYLSANGLQDPAESWSVTYDGLADGSQRPHTIGSGYSSSNLNQADVAMLADVVRARYGVTGKGIKIGIISTSFDALGGMADDIALGLLPAGMDGSDDRGNKYKLNDVSYEDDEGRAMAQLVHAIAPDAELYFATPFSKIKSPPTLKPNELLERADEWAAGMVTQIETLVNVINVDIIVDDLYNTFVPWFQDGIVAQAVDWAVEGNKEEGRKGVAYFSAAGNDTNTSFQSTFRGTPYSEISSQLPSSVLGNTELGNTEQYLYHDFNPDEGVVDILQKVQFPKDYSQSADDPNVLFVQWDQPWANNNSANEIWFFDDNEDRTFLGKTENEPSQPIAGYPLLPPSMGKTFHIAFVHNTHGYEGGGGQELPTYFKWIAVFNGSQPPVGEDFPQTSFIEYAEHGFSTVWGHNNSKLAANVGAAQYWSTPAYRVNPLDWESVLSEFSSFGGTPIFFDSNGQRQEPEYRPQPRFYCTPERRYKFFSTYREKYE